MSSRREVSSKGVNPPLAGYRIAFVVASMESGGAERVALNLAEEIARSGRQVDLVLVSAHGPLLPEVSPEVRIIDLRCERARRAIFKLRRYLRTVQPTAVIGFTFHVNLLTVLAHLGLGSRTRVILSVHSTFSGALREYSRVTRAIFYPATLLLYRFADWIVAVSNGAADDLARVAKLGRERIITIHNPVLGRGFDVAARESVHHRWIRAGLPVLVSVGRLSEAKDYPTLIRAFERVREVTNARLLIVGEGDKREEIEDIVRERGLDGDVELLGHVRNPLPYMKEADLFVMSSKREGFGNVLVEAMGVGTPVISTDCPHGPAEILEGGRWGRLVPVGDEVALADAIIATLQCGGVDARARAREFSVAAAADRYLGLLHASDTGRFRSALGD